MAALEYFIEGLLMAGARQCGRQFARRVADIQQGQRTP